MVDSTSLQESPRFVGPATFFRLPYTPEPQSWNGLRFGLVGIPFDGGTTNRAGTRHGPRALREASTLIAPWSSELDINPFAAGGVADLGDVWIREPFNLEPSLGEITAYYRELCARGVTPLSAGGDHSVSLPVLRAVGAKAPVAMVHIDAHCDTGMGYMGSRYHHGAPFSRAVEEGVLDPRRTVQVGIRGPANSADVWKFSRESGMRIVPMQECVALGIDAVIGEIRRVVGDSPCYLSFDIDSLDPAFAPGTGTPVLGGFTTREALQLVRGLRGLNLVGADLVEVSPPFDASGITALAGATLMFEMLCLLSESRANARGA
jgi:guanidinopropionase